MDKDRMDGVTSIKGLVEEQILALHAEAVVIDKRVVTTATVRVNTVTHTYDQLVEEMLASERIEINHVPIGHYVETAPPTREEGDITIIPVLEEVLVVERRLLLKEEIHVRRVRSTELHRETVALRRQEAVVTRTAATDDLNNQNQGTAP